MDVTQEQFLYPAARVDVVHIGIKDDLQHHAGMIGTAAFFLVQLLEGFKVETVNYRTDYANRIVFRYVFIDSLRKKHQLVGSVRMIMYLWHV